MRNHFHSGIVSSLVSLKLFGKNLSMPGALISWNASGTSHRVSDENSQMGGPYGALRGPAVCPVFHRAFSRIRPVAIRGEAVFQIAFRRLGNRV